MQRLPFFKWYPADADTDQNFRAMDDADIGFYIRCLNHAWINGSIPADPKERARVLRTRLNTANKRWQRVGKCFVTSSLHPDCLINSRQEAERDFAVKKSQLAKESVKVRIERSSNDPIRALAGAASGSDSVSVSEAEEEKRMPTEEEKRFWISKTMLDFPGARILGRLPDERIVEQCYKLAGGDMDLLGKAFRALFLTGKKPEHSWGWFPKVLPDYVRRARQ